MREQEQFLQVLDRDEAERRFRAAIDLAPRGVETVPLDAALGRVLAADVISPVDVPSFDRSNVDGFAVRGRGHVRRVRGSPARRPARRRSHSHRDRARRRSSDAATAVSIATGGMIPRGADAVVMVEHADVRRRRAAHRARGHRRAAACRSPEPTSPPARRCSAADRS